MEKGVGGMAIKEELGIAPAQCSRVGQPSDSTAGAQMADKPEDMYNEAHDKIMRKDVMTSTQASSSAGTEMGSDYSPDLKGPPKELFEELPPWKRVEKRPREDESDVQGKKKRRGKARCRPGANERRWKQLEAAQRDSL